MDEATRQALEESIAHWERLKACKSDQETFFDEGIGSEECPLCKIHLKKSVGAKNAPELLDYHGAPNGINCDGCPIRIATGEHGCHGSPYYDFSNAVIFFDMTTDHDTYPEEFLEQYQELAQAEIDFLRGLLEE